MTFWGGGNRVTRSGPSGRHMFLEEVIVDRHSSQTDDIHQQPPHGHGKSKAHHTSGVMVADATAQIDGHHEDQTSDESQAEEAGAMVDDEEYTRTSKSSKRKVKHTTTDDRNLKKPRTKNTKETNNSKQTCAIKEQKTEEHATARRSRKLKTKCQFEHLDEAFQQDLERTASNHGPDLDDFEEHKQVQDGVSRPSRDDNNDVASRNEPCDPNPNPALSFKPKISEAMGLECKLKLRQNW
nr:hypothetical protein CFP56_73402 [Quercus suber]